MRIVAIFLAFLLVASCGGSTRSYDPGTVAATPAGLDTLCGDRRLKGYRHPDVRNGACGINNPVEVHYVNGVRLTTPALLNCGTARELAGWVDNKAEPILGRIEALRVAASYACRTRNSQSGGRISEHAKGNAIDISAFILPGDETITVLDGWGSRKYGRTLRRLHRSACGPFGTVLGPEADRFHQDHFHFDTASYRGGPFCQ